MKAENQITNTSQSMVDILGSTFDLINKVREGNSYKLTIDVTNSVLIEKGVECIDGNCITINPGEKPEIQTRDLKNIHLKAVGDNADLILLVL